MKFLGGVSLVLPVILACVDVSAEEDATHDFYQVNALKLGVEVFGIDLKEDVPENVIAQIKEDVIKYRLMVFRDQGIISGDRQVEITYWFGDIIVTFAPSKTSPHPYILRVSNDENEGLTNYGTSGWHFDGSFLENPNSHSLYHMWNASKGGDTKFVGLTDVVESLSEETYQRWDRLWWMHLTHHKVIHPLVHHHPQTGKQVLCLHLGYTNLFIWDYGMDEERKTDTAETQAILEEIREEIEKDNGRFVYSHEWTAGELIITDNLALGHQASAKAQGPLQEVGLRVLHRTTVRGEHIPAQHRQQQKTMQNKQTISDEL